MGIFGILYWSWASIVGHLLKPHFTSKTQDLAWVLQVKNDDLLVRENRLLRDLCLKRLKSLLNQMTANSLLLSRGSCRIPKRVRYGDSRNNTVCAYRLRDRNDSAHMDYRELALNFFQHRCTASSTSSSGRGQDYCCNSVRNQLIGDLSAKTLGACDSRAVANG